MKTVKSIEFIFENCESITIDNVDNVGCFCMNKIWLNIQRYACNAICKFDYVDEVYIELLKEADGEHYPFNDKEHFEKDKETIFDRIKYGDITSITITYEDDTEDHYLVHYEEEYPNTIGTINKCQDTKISEQGNLYLVISKDNKKVNDIFEEYFENIEGEN